MTANTQKYNDLYFSKKFKNSFNDAYNEIKNNDFIESFDVLFELIMKGKSRDKKE